MKERKHANHNLKKLKWFAEWKEKYTKKKYQWYDTSKSFKTKKNSKVWFFPKMLTWYIKENVLVHTTTKTISIYIGLLIFSQFNITFPISFLLLLFSFLELSYFLLSMPLMYLFALSSLNTFYNFSPTAVLWFWGLTGSGPEGTISPPSSSTWRKRKEKRRKGKKIKRSKEKRRKKRKREENKEKKREK